MWHAEDIKGYRDNNSLEYHGDINQRLTRQYQKKFIEWKIKDDHEFMTENVLLIYGFCPFMPSFLLENINKKWTGLYYLLTRLDLSINSNRKVIH